MKRNVTLLATLVFGFFISMQLFAQCEPDTANCEDIGDPGQFCPLELADASLDVLYDQVVTIIAPGIYEIFNSEVIIHFIEIDSVKNLPPGIDYFPNADKFFPDTAYCIQLTGTPTQAGVFNLSIYIGATVDIYGTPTKASVLDDSSVVITVVGELGTDPRQMTEFQVFQNVPNPFSDFTRLAYFAPKAERVELSVYNILGVQVYQESDYVLPGDHFFDFDGSELQRGTYLYRVRTSDAYYTGKLVKSN